MNEKKIITSFGNKQEKSDRAFQSIFCQIETV